MKLILKLPITAKCIKESDESKYWLTHDLKLGEKYEVNYIEKGNSTTTSVKLFNDKDELKTYNSVILEFYYKDRKIDIYKSPLFNPYTKHQRDKLIHFIEEELLHFIEE